MKKLIVSIVILALAVSPALAETMTAKELAWWAEIHWGSSDPVKALDDPNYAGTYRMIPVDDLRKAVAGTKTAMEATQAIYSVFGEDAACVRISPGIERTFSSAVGSASITADEKPDMATPRANGGEELTGCMCRWVKGGPVGVIVRKGKVYTEILDQLWMVGGAGAIVSR